jgi:hypothetical protein
MAFACRYNRPPIGGGPIAVSVTCQPAVSADLRHAPAFAAVPRETVKNVP